MKRVGRMHIHPTCSYPKGLNKGPPSAAAGWRQAWRWLRRTLLAVLLLLVAVVLAWVATHWRDADAQPRPAELALPPPTLPAQRNLAYTLMGLQAAADPHPNCVGSRCSALTACPFVTLRTSQPGRPRHAAL